VHAHPRPRPRHPGPGRPGGRGRRPGPQRAAGARGQHLALHGYLTASFPFSFRITIADNASTDGTWLLAKRLVEQLPAVRAVHVPQKGRGRALRQVWSASDAAVVRGPKRELVSRCYNLLLRTMLRARFSDAQRGFKAGRTEVVQALLPAVEDQAWFFDTELLLAAQRGGLRIHEVPVDWVEDTDSRVDVVRTALDDLRGMARVARQQLPASPPSGPCPRWPTSACSGCCGTTPGPWPPTPSPCWSARWPTPPPPCSASCSCGRGCSTPAAPPSTQRSPETMTSTSLERPLGAARIPDRLARLLRGRTDDPAWARPSLLGLLAATALLYLWALSASGWANDFYSAAAQAASQSWKAFFFGSSDAASFITVDKPPAALWVMGLSARLFGVSSWSLLAPQALMGVATGALLYATVRRWFGPAAGLLAGAVTAPTPVATLIFRFNNPDALLTLLLVAGAYAVVRALEDGATRWLVLAGACVGFGFLAKQLQALLVVSAFALVYLAAVPGSLGRRLGQLVAAGAAMVASAGWWVAIVELLPASARPYVGGSQTNSILELTFGYNGLGRLTGNETGSVGGGPGGGWGQTGWTRMFGAEVGGQVAWLLPAALLLLAAGLWLTRKAPRTNRARAAFALWGGWLVVTGVVFSFMQGIFHAYYAVALAPAVGALVGMGATGLWEVRRNLVTRRWLAGTVAVTAVWSWVLLRRTPDWHPELAPLVLLGGLAVAALIAAVPWQGLAGAGWAGRGGRRMAAAVAGAGLLVALAGPAAYSLDTAATAHGGAIPSAGPAVQGGGPGGRGGMGGLLDGGTPGAELVALLGQDADRCTWVAAAIGSNSAAGVQLATGEPVMAIGGFNGSDPAPTLAQFQQYVAEGRIHYFLGGGMGGRSMGGSDAARQISAWVAENFTATSVGGATVYDLTAR
jgi:4-amino-4-deoxy-L-arabinose transferase-like glycosyltransferase